MEGSYIIISLPNSININPIQSKPPTYPIEEVGPFHNSSQKPTSISLS